MAGDGVDPGRECCGLVKVADIEAVTDAMEKRVRDELPEMKNIFVEADSDFDPTKESPVD